MRAGPCRELNPQSTAPRRAGALLLAILLAGCGGTDQGPSPVAVPRDPAPAPTAAQGATADGGLQRAWGARFGGGSVIAMAGSEYVAKIRETIPALVLVLRVTNGADAPLPLSRELDEVVVHLRDGTRLVRADIWERPDWLAPMAGMAPEERMRFVYPGEVLPRASVDFNVTFETTAALSDVAKIWVKLASHPSDGAWMEEIAAGR